MSPLDHSHWTATAQVLIAAAYRGRIAELQSRQLTMAIPARRCSRSPRIDPQATRRYGRARRRAERVGRSVRLSRLAAWCPAFDDAPRWRQETRRGEHHGLPHGFARQPRFRFPPQHGSWPVHRSCPLAPHHARAELVGELLKGRLVGDRKHQVEGEGTARRTCRASDWRP